MHMPTLHRAKMLVQIYELALLPARLRWLSGGWQGHVYLGYLQPREGAHRQGRHRRCCSRLLPSLPRSTHLAAMVTMSISCKPLKVWFCTPLCCLIALGRQDIYCLIRLRYSPEYMLSLVSVSATATEKSCLSAS